MKRTIILISSMLFGSALIGGATAWLVAKNTQNNTIETPANFAAQSGAGNHFASYQKESFPDLTYAAENAVEAVVNIESIQEVKQSSGSRFGGSNPLFEFFGFPQGYGDDSYQQQPREVRAGGSGVIISADGYIVTNNHVIENASKLKVTLNDDRTFEAKIIGTDPTTDVALIKIDAKDLPTLSFGSSDALRLGEWVLAIGSPFDLQSTITAGIVSAKARNLGAIPSQYSVESFIQTDAAVNPGNSGGALVNTSGELVGINTLIKSQTGTYMGYSFAVPSDIVKKVVVDLKDYGVVQRALLGISYREINDDFIEQMGKELDIKEKNGLYVAEVQEGGAAEAAGIKKGDVIIGIDGQNVTKSGALSAIIAQHRPNDKIKISLKRNGEVKQIEAILRNKAGKAELLSKDYVDANDMLGGTFGEINDRTKKQLGIDGGIRVTSVKDGGMLSKARISEGYIITAINDTPIKSISDLNKVGEKITLIEGVYPNGRFVNYALGE